MKFIILKSFKIEFVNQEIDASLRVNAAIGKRTYQSLLYCEVLGNSTFVPLNHIWHFRVKAPFD